MIEQSDFQYTQTKLIKIEIYSELTIANEAGAVILRKIQLA